MTVVIEGPLPDVVVKQLRSLADARDKTLTNIHTCHIVDHLLCVFQDTFGKGSYSHYYPHNSYWGLEGLSVSFTEVRRMEDIERVVKWLHGYEYIEHTKKDRADITSFQYKFSSKNPRLNSFTVFFRMSGETCKRVIDVNAKTQKPEPEYEMICPGDPRYDEITKMELQMGVHESSDVV